MYTKKMWIQEQKDREAEARKNGYSDLEIREAYKLAREKFNVSYFGKWDLLEAKKKVKAERLTN